MKVALVSTGLGRVVRGFESFSGSLFKALRRHAPQIDVTLFQGGGKNGERQVVVPNLHRYDAPARWFGYEKGNLLEKRSFALALYPLLRWGRYDIVHYNEPVMGSALYHLRRTFGGKYKILYCGGSPAPPSWYQDRCDFAQMLTEPAYNEAREFGLEEKRLFLIPYGIEAKCFSPEERLHRFEIRRELGIPHDAKVVLTVAMLDRATKRIDHVIKELSSVKNPVWLVAAGQRTEETSSLEEDAKLFIPDRWRFVSWPYERIPRLYAAADVFVLASLKEGFGLVIVEAMLSGLPVIIHNGPTFQWVAQNTSARLINMARERELADALNETNFVVHPPRFREEVARRFSWETLIPQYLAMYKQVIGADNGRL
jgi:1,2-diacylglycerol 3-alpha-glucosyltransferase